MTIIENLKHIKSIEYGSFDFIALLASIINKKYNSQQTCPI